MAKSESRGSKNPAASDEGRRAQQPRPGRTHQLRRNKARRTTAPITAEATAKGAKAGQQTRNAKIRQTKTVKQIRTTIPVTSLRARPIGKVQLARAVQPRQLSSVKSLTAAISAASLADLRPIGKITSARVAQVRQRSSVKLKNQLKSG